MKAIELAMVIALGSAQVMGQAGKTPTKKPVAKAPAKTAPATAAKPAAPAANPTAVIHTSEGDLSCALARDKVPGAVDNFVGLATGTKNWTDPRDGSRKTGVPLYDGTIFHRVIPDFMIQGGDRKGDGTGRPGYTIPDEFSPELKFDKPGVLAYANSGANTSGSQFFITEVPYPSLDPCLDESGCARGMRTVPKGYGYTIFGQCTPESVELVKKIAREPRGANDRPQKAVVIQHIEIQGLAKAATPAKKAPTKKTGTKTPVTKK